MSEHDLPDDVIADMEPEPMRWDEASRTWVPFPQGEALFDAIGLRDCPEGDEACACRALDIFHHQKHG